ncbi:class IV adenylate cyclase [Lactobacillus helsingborgensis]|uniref:class IV adenylate cyclase n=1 Tax=Lactobacillus helsingborgensis TaxID=1218494 RepID=UPI001650A9E4|nr:class IV adenylate cyclase [Lactobacillus helsingborgensis]MBC6356706.1 class IV adenylate cyclase [Lactobacillus helsingborgensis]
MINEIINQIVAEHILNDFTATVNQIIKRSLVYTSFDGDYMHYIPDMHKFCLNQNLIPINPESALGYYVSTINHNNSKIPVMRDCLSLSLLCDQFFAFTSEKQNLSEGVIAEIIYWNRIKDKKIKMINFFNQCYGTRCKFEFTLDKKQIKDLNIKQTDEAEIESRLFKGFNSFRPKNCYIVASFYNFKHIDWIRAFCYKNNLCPISPQNILPYDIYREKYSSNINYLSDRISLLEKTDLLLFFTNTSNLSQEIQHLDFYSKFELYYWYMYRDRSKIKVIDWASINVPKYKNSSWSLTKSEENVKLGKSSFQKDSIFVMEHTKGFNIKPGDPVLRIRKEKKSSKLTLKRKISNTNSVEYETLIEKPDVMTEILRCLGFKEIEVVTKTRREAHCGEINVCYDIVDELGIFFELEIMVSEKSDIIYAQDKIQAFANKIGLTENEIEKDQYDTLVYNKHRNTEI